MVAKEMDTFVKLKNPYTFGVPVRGEGKFFGRDEELRIIFNTLENVPRGQKQDLVIMGPRRIGKSSLLYRLVDLLVPHQDFVPVYVDVQNTKPRTTRPLFLSVLRKIKEGYRQKNPLVELPRFKTLESDQIPVDLEFFTFDEDMTCLNHLIATQNLPRLVLMFDEVELLVEFGGRDTLDWFRSLIQSLSYSIFVVAGSEQIYALTQDYGSPFYNIFKTIELHPLTPEAAKKLLTVPANDIGLEIPSAEVDKILRYAGHNPYLIQGIAHYLVEELNVQKRCRVRPQDVDKVVKNSVEHFSPHFAYIWGRVSQVQRVILYTLAKGGIPRTMHGLISNLPQPEIPGDLAQSKSEQEYLFDDLVEQQILKVERGNRYWFVALLFVAWILSKVDDEEVTRFAPSFDTIEVKEYNLAAIRLFLTASFNDEELTVLTFDHFPSVYNQLSSGMSKSQKIQRLLDHCVRHRKLDKLLLVVRGLSPARYATYFTEDTNY